MDRHLEAVTKLQMSPQRVVELLTADPAATLTGTPSEDHGSFVGRVAVEVAGGTSLSHDVEVAFGQLLNEGAVARFGLSWRARGHQNLFPVFGGDLEVHPDEHGARLRLAGYYTLPLGALGAFGDGLVGHHVARRAVQGFLDAVAARLATAGDGLVAASAARPLGQNEPPHSELYIG